MFCLLIVDEGNVVGSQHTKGDLNLMTCSLLQCLPSPFLKNISGLLPFKMHRHICSYELVTVSQFLARKKCNYLKSCNHGK